MIGHAEGDGRDPRRAELLWMRRLYCARARPYFGALEGHADAGGGKLVAIQGLGGLGHLALQFALKLGCKAVVVSRGRDKEALALKLGATAYIDSSSGDAGKQLQAMGGAAAIICTAPNGKAMSELIPGLATGGKMVIVAAGREPLTSFAVSPLGEEIDHRLGRRKYGRNDSFCHPCRRPADDRDISAGGGGCCLRQHDDGEGALPSRTKDDRLGN